MRAFTRFVVLALAALGVSASAYEFFAVKDAVDIQRRTDGNYDVICADGTYEMVTVADITTNNICPSTKGATRLCIESVLRLPDGIFKAICTDGRHETGTADDIVSGKLCTCKEPPKPVPAAKVDILFVVDNSGSMFSHQKNLVQNIDAFINGLGQLSAADWQIGVITTDVPQDGGRLQGSPPVVTPKTPDFASVLRQNLDRGVYGSAIEKHFDAVTLALSEPLISTLNGGFHRPEAHLAIVFVTDAEDESEKTSGSDLIKFLGALKSSTNAKVLAYGVLALEHSRCPQDNYRAPDQLQNVIHHFAGKVYDLCAPDWGTKLHDIASDIMISLR